LAWTVESQVERLKEIQKQRKALGEEAKAARDTLRGILKSDEATEDQKQLIRGAGVRTRQRRKKA